MTEIVTMTAAEPVIFGVVKIIWADGYTGLVDLRPLIDKGAMFAFLRQNHERFGTLTLDSNGQKIFWLDDDGDEIDFGADALRARAERQAGLLHLAS